MADGMYFREESRTTARFEPKDPLSVYLADKMAFLVQGDVKNISELGACVATNAALKRGAAVTVDVRSGYSFLFRTEARVVWCAKTGRAHEPRECVHGIHFTDLSPFSRKLIRRLGGGTDRTKASIAGTQERPRWENDADSDPDLEILFREELSLGGADDDWFEIISDPSFDDRLFDGPDRNAGDGSHHAQGPRDPTAGGPPAQRDHLGREGFGLVELRECVESFGNGDFRLDGIRASDHLEIETLSAVDGAVVGPTPGSRPKAAEVRRDANAITELSGNLGYFSNTDVLQMLELARATGILFLEGEPAGEIHLRDGRICGCFSKKLSDEEAAFRLLVARRGRFRFVPSDVRTNIRKSRTTTQLLLEAELRRNQEG